MAGFVRKFSFSSKLIYSMKYKLVAQIQNVYIKFLFIFIFICFFWSYYEKLYIVCIYWSSKNVVTIYVCFSRRWSHGLLFHQAIVDCARAAILLPLGIAVFRCQPVYKCSLVETAFLLLVRFCFINFKTSLAFSFVFRFVFNVSLLKFERNFASRPIYPLDALGICTQLYSELPTFSQISTRQITMSVNVYNSL